MKNTNKNLGNCTCCGKDFESRLDSVGGICLDCSATESYSEDVISEVYDY